MCDISGGGAPRARKFEFEFEMVEAQKNAVATVEAQKNAIATVEAQKNA
jgi:hypothetical protein